MIHPSFLGNIDLLVCGNSDPGTSGMLSPYGKIEGLYFNNSREPDSFMFNFKQDLREAIENEDVEYIEIKADNKEDYYKIINELYEFNQSAIKVSGVSKNEYTIIVENLNEEGQVEEEASDSNE